jgi:hypothetical protein
VSIVNVDDNGPYRLPVTVDVGNSYQTVDLYIDGMPIASGIGPFYSWTTLYGPDISSLAFGQHTLAISACGDNGCQQDSKTFSRSSDTRGDVETVTEFWVGLGTGANKKDEVVPQTATFSHSLGETTIITSYNVTNIGGGGRVEMKHADSPLVYNPLLGDPEPLVSVSHHLYGIGVGDSPGNSGSMGGCGWMQPDFSGGLSDNYCLNLAGFGGTPSANSSVAGFGQVEDDGGLTAATFISTGVNISW